MLSWLSESLSVNAKGEGWKEDERRWRTICGSVQRNIVHVPCSSEDMIRCVFYQHC